MADQNPRLSIRTSMGSIEAELWPGLAPRTVENVLSYAQAGHYDGLIFHRVIPGFMIQGGGMTPDLRTRPTQAPVPNEASGEAKNRRGTLAMARTSDPHSATGQFFINLADNDFLDHTGKTPQGWGYAVFGQVVEGMDVVDKIAAVRTGNKGPHQDVPAEPVVIESIRQVDPQ